MPTKIENFMLMKKSEDVTWLFAVDDRLALRDALNFAQTYGIKTAVVRNFSDDKDHNKLVKSEI